MFRNIVCSVLCVVILSGMSEGMNVDQERDTVGVGMEFRLFPICDLTEYEKKLILFPAEITMRVSTDSEVRTAVETLARRSTHHMLVGSYEKNQVALKNWLIFHNACIALGGSFLDQLEEEKDRLVRRFESIDAYFVDDLSNSYFYITGILEQLAVFDSEYRLQLIEIYENGLDGGASNPERSAFWTKFQQDHK